MEALTSNNLTLPLIFLQFAFMISVKVLTVCEIFSCQSFKSRKNRVTKAVSSLFSIFCFLRLSQIWSYQFIFYQQALRRAQIYLTVQQILGNSTEGNAINLARKIPVFRSQNIT